MVETLHRVQMLLEPRQHAMLTQIAKQQGRSVADVTREVINLGLAHLADQESFNRRAAALQQADQFAARMQLLDRDVIEDLARLRQESDEQISGSN